MKKIGILTFHRAINYGGVLQNYALQKELVQMGFDVETIDYKSVPVYEIYKPFYIGKFNPIKIPIKFIINLINYKSNKKIKKKFDKFITNNIKLSQPYSFDTVIKIENEYDYLVSGSDQVWNKDITKEDYNVYDLSLFNFNKKIAYAASIGKDVISSDDIDYYENLIKKYYMVSLREKSAVKKLNGKAYSVLDPVFFLDKNSWISNLNLNCKNNDEYIFVFSLERTKKITNLIKKLSKNYKIIYYSKVPIFYNNVVCKFDMSPQEFLETILNANFIITNSFHCMAFSIIFQKNFSAILHTNKGSRQKDLLKLLKLENRIFDNNIDSLINNNIDYCKIDKILKNSIKDSKEFLNKSIR